jgi:MoaA/NifB/PqqE/SkfB family radical SAM enzyme
MPSSAATTERVDIKIGFACNNRCVFCVQGDKRASEGARPAARILADLRTARERGAGAVVFTGGEPTLHASLLPSVRAAKELGFGTIQIQTNGRRLAYDAFCHALAAAGANEFAPALHGVTAATHDALTRAPGSFDETVAGILAVKRLGLPLVTNTVVTARNFRELPALARRLVDYGVDQFQFAFVHVVGTAADNRDWLVPRKSEVMPFVREGLDIGRAARVRCFTEAIPLCLMAGYEACVAESIIPRTLIFDAGHVIDDFTSYREHEGKAKGPACPSCSASAQCEGPWREYPALFGWDEFKARTL